jgi:hypothetical protein
MIHLDLDATERTILMEVLQSQLADLSYEIADTDQFDFRQELKTKRDVLHKILETVKQSHESG